MALTACLIKMAKYANSGLNCKYRKAKIHLSHFEADGFDSLKKKTLYEKILDIGF